VPFNFFSTLRLTFQHPRVPLFLPPLWVDSSAGEVPLLLLVKGDLLLWGVAGWFPQTKNQIFLIKKVARRFFLREILLYE
jgi:hypothetical protein